MFRDLPERLLAVAQIDVRVGGHLYELDIDTFDRLRVTGNELPVQANDMQTITGWLDDLNFLKVSTPEECIEEHWVMHRRASFIEIDVDHMNGRFFIMARPIGSTPDELPAIHLATFSNFQTVDMARFIRTLMEHT